MVARPFVNWSFSEIETHAERNWKEQSVLEQIAAELRHRSRPNAKLLLSRVEKRLVELERAQAEKPKRSSGTRDQEIARLRAEIASLTKALETAELKTVMAEARATVAEKKAARDPHGFAKVGLTPDCPDFLLGAARKAYRSEYHPDRVIGRSPAAQKASEELFKHFDAVFERLLRTRASQAA